ncbi:terminase [Streptomyces anulatus]|uniref:terminase n=1 Tax=Streptomyces anulatus TaxID=1892 RepID=UPI0038633CC6|nr:terminase [Streptomyces anulatus]
MTPEHVFGHQQPRLFTVPGNALSSAGQEAVEIAASAGLHLDPWQQHILDKGMGERADGSWDSFEICVNVPRQNGKGGVIEARELWGLFVGGEELILHSAHEFKTAKAAFKRIERLIKSTPDLHKRVKTYRQTVGEEGIELHTGQLLRFIARSKGSGRGFTGDCNIMDEDMILGDEAMDALMFTMAAVPDPQVWYLGSAGIGAPSVQLGRLRRRAEAALESGKPDPSLAYFEWSIDPHRDECPGSCTAHDDQDSDESILKANPGVGYRLTLEKSRNERTSVSREGFARERLGVGTYPSDSADTWQVIGEDAWRSLAAAESAPEGEVVFAIDATPEQDHAAIAVAGRWRGGTHIEIAHHQPGMGWVVAKAKRMQEEHKPRCWVVDAGGPAGSLIQELEEELGIKVVSPKMREVAMAAGQFFNAVADQSLSHIDQPLLATALAGAQKRPLGEAWAWARRGVGVDISPLVAATNAKWGLGVEVEDDVDPLDNIF